jgi:hypothetical protein
MQRAQLRTRMNRLGCALLGSALKSTRSDDGRQKWPGFVKGFLAIVLGFQLR